MKILETTTMCKHSCNTDVMKRESNSKRKRVNKLNISLTNEQNHFFHYRVVIPQFSPCFLIWPWGLYSHWMHKKYHMEGICTYWVHDNIFLDLINFLKLVNKLLRKRRQSKYLESVQMKHFRSFNAWWTQKKKMEQVCKILM